MVAIRKKIARRAFEAAFQRELDSMLETLKISAGKAQTGQDAWEIESYLTAKRKEIDYKYDFRYSQLLLVFGMLLREGWLREDDISGLTEDKIQAIVGIANF